METPPTFGVCLGCDCQVPINLVGPWCDRCGGVAARPGVLLLRHVATVDGPGGRFPICFDRSTADYSCTLPIPTPRQLANKRDLDGLYPVHNTTYHGSLDLILGLVQPFVRGPKGPDGEPPPLPELSAAPSATDEEKALLEL